jgi:hypothetical protein
MMILKKWEKNTNSEPGKKIALRKYFLEKLKSPRILECYGSKGLMYQNCYQGFSADSFFKGIDYSQYNFFDLDAFSDPSSYLRKILINCSGIKVIIITDNSLHMGINGRQLEKFFPLQIEEGRHLIFQYQKLWFQFFKLAGSIIDFKWTKNNYSTYYIGCQLDIKNPNIFHECFTLVK